MLCFCIVQIIKSGCNCSGPCHFVGSPRRRSRGRRQRRTHMEAHYQGRSSLIESIKTSGNLATPFVTVSTTTTTRLRSAPGNDDAGRKSTTTTCSRTFRSCSNSSALFSGGGCGSPPPRAGRGSSISPPVFSMTATGSRAGGAD